MCNTTKGCCSSTSQPILAIINFISFLISLLLLIIFTFIKIISFEDVKGFLSSFLNFEEDIKETIFSLFEHIYETKTVNNLLLFIVIVLAVITFSSMLGFVGAVSGNRILLIAYMALASLTFLVHLVVFIALFFNMSFIYKSFVTKELDTSASILLSKYNTNYNEGICSMFKILSEEFDCCGTNRYQFQNETISLNNQTVDASQRCCTSYQTIGCEVKLNEFLSENQTKTAQFIEYIIFNSLTLFFQLINILLAVLVLMGVINRLDKNKKRKAYIEKLEKNIEMKKQNENINKAQRFSYTK